MPTAQYLLSLLQTIEVRLFSFEPYKHDAGAAVCMLHTLKQT